MQSGRLNILMFLFIAVLLISGCGLKDKANTLKEDLINISVDQVASALENSLNSQLPGVQVDNPNVIGTNGQVDWEQVSKTKLANYTFYNFGNYEFRAVLLGDGVFKIERVNHKTGQSYSYAEFQTEMAGGKLEVKAK